MPLGFDMTTLAIRPRTASVETPFGTVELDLGDPCLIRAAAGGPNAPLAKDGVLFGLAMGFGWNPATDRFGLLAEGGPMAWEDGAPDAPAPKGWKDVALAVDRAVEAYVESHPILGDVARRFSARRTLGIQSTEGMNPAIVEMRASLLRLVAA